MGLNALYAVVDRLYIGRGCGEAAMAGLSLTFPLMMLFGAFGVFIGAGHAAVLSIRLGAGDTDACERIAGELVALKLAFFALLAPLVFFNLDTVLGWCGGGKVSPEAFDCARRYMRIVLPSQLFAHLAFGLSTLTRAEGGAVRSMVSMAVGFGVNIVLDPLMIFGLGLGVEGAAWATDAAMLVSCLWAFGYYWRGDNVVALRWRRIGVYRDLVARTLSIGFAPFLQQLLGAAINISLAAAFAHWAADNESATTQIASLGVFQGMSILAVLPIFGVQQGLQPIFGYNWGARNFRRVHEALTKGYWVTTAFCVAACVVQTVPPFPQILASLFADDANQRLVQIAAHDLSIANCMLWCISVNVVATTYFQSIGHPLVAIVLSTLRQGVILLPCIWILPLFISDSTFAIWLALPVSDVLCQLATIPPILSHLRFLRLLRDRNACGIRR